VEVRAAERWRLRRLRCKLTQHRSPFYDSETDEPKVLLCRRCMRAHLVYPHGPLAAGRDLHAVYDMAALFEPAEKTVAAFWAPLEGARRIWTWGQRTYL
jgi:hypothetical protein